ncbi:MAG: DUF2313 domain-containing protein [Clostridium sp.]|nr:DUF2313 domain-containing protein [Clostridium sp.]
MSYRAYLRDVLSPLGVYDLSAPFNGGELTAQGAALDGAEEALDEVSRESNLATAESWGLEEIAGLLSHRPAATDPRSMARALAALLRIGGDSFTLAAINDTLTGCGVTCRVDETETAGTVRITVPGTPGVPDEFEEMKQIIEDILPAHLLPEYQFRYLTWAGLEAALANWTAVENQALSWAALETYMQ